MLLADDPMVREGRGEHFADAGLDLAVDVGHEVGCPGLGVDAAGAGAEGHQIHRAGGEGGRQCKGGHREDEVHGHHRLEFAGYEPQGSGDVRRAS